MKIGKFTSSLFILSSFSPPVFAQSILNNDVNAQVIFHPITLQAEEQKHIGVQKYTKIDLETIENSSKNLTDFLRLHPNVKFDQDQYSALQQGELKPTDISINGALPYENKFLLNGLSINNQLNPTSNFGPNNHSELMGNSQAITLNTDLICEINVLDSNISAAYGEFLGGVVEAKTCRPQTVVGEIHGHFSYDYTSDRWSSYHYANDQQRHQFEESTSADIQPNFIKQGLSTALYGNLSEHLGVSLSAAQRWSKIPLKNALQDVSLPTQTRENQNLSLESFYRLPNDAELRIGLHVLENQGLHYQTAVKDSQVKHSSDSKALFTNFSHKLGSIALEQQLNYQVMHSERDGIKDTFSWLSSDSKNWNPKSTVSIEGSFGHFEQAEEKFEYAVKAHFQPLEWGPLRHSVQTGLGYGHYSAYWQRENPSHWYVSNTNLRGQGCQTLLGEYDLACDESLTHLTKFDGQFARTRTTYEAGLIDITQDRWHAFINNQFNLHQTIRSEIGVRLDYDSLTKQTHFAPRSLLTIQPFSEHHFKVTSGWNRYYGLNAFQNELQDRKRMLQVTENRNDINSPWQENEDSRYSRMQVRSHLDSPFSDEIMLALHGKLSTWAWQAKWVNRHAKKQIRLGKEQIIEKPNGNGVYSIFAYENSGSSKTNIYTLSLENTQPWAYAGMQHLVQFSADYAHNTRNFNSYDDPYADPNQLIYYNNQLIKWADRPADNFNTPWTVRANWHMQMNALPLQINHTLHYRAPTERIVLEYSPQSYISDNFYDAYVTKMSTSAFFWDLKATYSLALSQKLSSLISLSVNNVTNKKNFYIHESGNRLPEIGRQYIAEVKLKF